MVSLAILAGMMALVAMVFSSASKSSGQAQTSAMIHRHLQQITDTIRRDLEGIDPGTCVLGIVGVDILAVDRPGYPTTSVHRADVLMLLTQRGMTFEPYVYEPTTDEFSNIRHVVYGHANLARLDAAGAWLAASLRTVEPATAGQASPIAASQWHLARRVVGFPDPNATSGLSNPENAGTWPLTGDRFTGAGAAGLFTDVYRDTAKSLLNYVPAWAGYTATPGLSGEFKYTFDSIVSQLYVLDSYYLDHPSGYRYRCDLGTAAYYLLDKSFWWMYDPAASPAQWVRRVRQPTGGDVVVPHPDGPPPSGPPVPAIPGIAGSAPAYAVYNTPTSGGSTNPLYWPEWFYTGGNSRVMLDPAPPAGMADRMAAYFLPGCSDFLVEFTYDDPREIMIGADGQPVLTRTYDQDGDGTSDAAEQVPAPTPVRWQAVPHGGLYIWSGLPTDTTLYRDLMPTDLRDMTNPYRWPRAVRITMRAHDERGALEQPVTQTIIHVFN